MSRLGSNFWRHRAVWITRESAQLMTYTGTCHCGNLSIEYRTALALPEWALRECQCSFCRKHAMLSTSNSKGEVALTVRDPTLLSRYRFATAVTDFLVCARCGVYVGTTIQNDRSMVINGRVMDCAAALLAHIADRRFYDDESANERIAHRKAMWSRCTVVGG